MGNTGLKEGRHTQKAPRTGAVHTRDCVPNAIDAMSALNVAGIETLAYSPVLTEASTTRIRYYSFTRLPL